MSNYPFRAESNAESMPLQKTAAGVDSFCLTPSFILGR